MRGRGSKIADSAFCSSEKEREAAPVSRFFFLFSSFVSLFFFLTVRSTRAHDMPASSISLSVSTSRHAGPRVAMTGGWFVRGEREKEVFDLSGGLEEVDR